MKLSPIILSIMVLLGCAKDNTKTMSTIVNPPVNSSAGKISYLALGDSYTIGEAVSHSGSFPYQLMTRLNAEGLSISPPEIIAKTGWTTSELQEGIKQSGTQQKYGIVTLLIGVNNQYRGGSREVYRKEFKELLQIAINFADGRKDHVFVVSIPDWGVTPFASQSGRNRETIATEIDEFNKINREETLVLGISYTDITPGSRLALNNTGLIASDGLHPSVSMYSNWVEQLIPSVIGKIK